MENIIVVVVLLTLVGGISWYLLRQKKKGATCIGCPYGKECRGKCSGNTSKK